MKKYFLTLSLILLSMVAFADDAVSWSFRLINDNTEHPEIEISASIDRGYHMFSVDNPAGGSMPLSFLLRPKGVSLTGNLWQTNLTKRI